MITTDGELRQAYASHSREAVPDGHPEPEELWRLAAGELGADESRGLVDHLSRCPACAEDFRLTRALVAEAPAADSPAAERRLRRRLGPGPDHRRGGSRWLQGLAVAATLAAVAVGLNWLDWNGRSPEPERRAAGPTFRQGAEEPVRSLLPPGEALPRDAARLRWTGPEGALYDVVVTTRDLRVLVDVQGLTARDLLIPASDLAGLAAGTVLFWQVEAVLPDGGRIPSRSFDVRLADESMTDESTAGE